MQLPITLSAPSRLHFGLLSIGRQSDFEFGGIGLMIDSPRTVVTVGPAPQLNITGEGSDVCRSAMENWFTIWKTEIDAIHALSYPLDSCADLPVAIDIESLPPRHCGLGSGTQLALCTIAAIHKFLTLPLPSPDEFSVTAGRGNRSAIGSYGFFRGGFLVDRGKSPHDAIAPLDFRTDFPAQWPVVIFLQRNASGMFGVTENQVFEDLPATDRDDRNKMIDLVRHQIIPGILNRDYQQFGQAISQYGHNSGLYFQQIQGGPYNGELVTDLVSSIRSLDVPAVGQTSWGPGVFAIAPDMGSASRLAEKIYARFGDQFEIIITRADNSGVREIAKKIRP